MKDNLLCQQMKGSPQGCSVIAVASGKGGVGKTSLSANLAICLAAKGSRVTLFDADMGLANLDLVMNIHSRYNLSHLLSGQKAIEEIICSGPCGVDVVCGANGLEQLADLTEFQRERLVSELEKLYETSDVLIIDTGAGIQKTVVGFCLSANSVMVVTTSEPTAITDAYAMIKVLAANKYQGRINLVVNMAVSVAEGKKVYRQISSVAMKFLQQPVYDGGVVLKDDAVSASIKARKPVVLGYPRAKASRAIMMMASRFSSTYGKTTEKRGFFRKVVSRFF